MIGADKTGKAQTDLPAQAACLGIGAKRTERVCSKAGAVVAKVPYHAAQHGRQHADLLCQAGNAAVCFSVLHAGVRASSWISPVEQLTTSHISYCSRMV